MGSEKWEGGMSWKIGEEIIVEVDDLITWVCGLI